MSVAAVLTGCHPDCIQCEVHSLPSIVVRRGYLPRLTYSSHYIRNDKFRSAVRNALFNERQEIQYVLNVIESEESPYKEGRGNPESNSMEEDMLLWASEMKRAQE